MFLGVLVIMGWTALIGWFFHQLGLEEGKTIRSLEIVLALQTIPEPNSLEGLTQRLQTWAAIRGTHVTD